MIAFIIRELTHLKVLHPIISKFIEKKTPYIILHYDVPRGDKEYNRATIKKLCQSSPKIIKNSKKNLAFANDTKLLELILKNRCKKVVAIEFSLAHKSISKSAKKYGIKIYSVNYLTDSMWVMDYSKLSEAHRTFYTANHIRKCHFEFMNKPVNDIITKCFGSPLLDHVKDISEGDETLVLLPNIRTDSVSRAFGSSKRFIKIISNIYDKSGPLIFKTRKKQWFPGEIRRYAKEIIYDGNLMYPSALSDALKRSRTAVMFYSSGIYEAVYSGAHVINIMSSTKQWRWDRKLMDKYFSNSFNSLYNFPGAVSSVSIDDAAASKFNFDGASPEARKEWVKKFIDDVSVDSAEEIANEIILS